MVMLKNQSGDQTITALKKLSVLSKAVFFVASRTRFVIIFKQT